MKDGVATTDDTRRTAGEGISEKAENEGAAGSIHPAEGECVPEPFWAWFCSVPGLYPAHKRLLIEQFGGPEAVWRAGEKELKALGRDGQTWIEKLRQFQKKEDPESVMHRLRKKGIHFISRQHRQFPGRLAVIPDAPYGIFYQGELPAEDVCSVAVVGARMCTRYGKEMAELAARTVAECGGQVVSGAAYGIDGVAQMEAFRAGGKSYAVLGSGVDRRYPESNGALFELLETQGGILSEFPPGTAPLRMHFPLRNRLISGLADVVVVVEARKKSGSLITADFAAEQGREVFAVPGRLGDDLSEGCNELISQGAGIFLSADRFAETVFGSSRTKKSGKYVHLTLAPSENMVYSSLGLHSKSIQELQECTGLSFADLSEALLRLEQQGLVRETVRNYYAKMK